MEEVADLVLQRTTVKRSNGSCAELARREEENENRQGGRRSHRWQKHWRRRRRSALEWSREARVRRSRGTGGGEGRALARSWRWSSLADGEDNEGEHRRRRKTRQKMKVAGSFASGFGRHSKPIGGRRGSGGNLRSSIRRGRRSKSQDEEDQLEGLKKDQGAAAVKPSL